MSILHFEVALVSTSISWCSQRHRAIPDRPIIPFFLVYGRKSSDWENHQRVGIICGVLIKSTANSLIKAGYVWKDTISVSSQLSIKIQVCICCRYKSMQRCFLAHKKPKSASPKVQDAPLKWVANVHGSTWNFTFFRGQETMTWRDLIGLYDFLFIIAKLALNMSCI